MKSFTAGLNPTAKTDTLTRITALHHQGKLSQFIALDDPWEHDGALLHQFGTLPDKSDRFGTRRQVRCSPLLYAFILSHTSYAHKITGPDPVFALEQLLRSCFVGDNHLFTKAYSPYQLLCSSHMNMDMAFVRAVRLASALLSKEAMPVGFISIWPLPESDTGL